MTRRQPFGSVSALCMRDAMCSRDDDPSQVIALNHEPAAIADFQHCIDHSKSSFHLAATAPRRLAVTQFGRPLDGENSRPTLWQPGAWLQRTNLWLERTNLRARSERLSGVANGGAGSSIGRAFNFKEIEGLAAPNKCLAQSNKFRTGSEATNE